MVYRLRQYGPAQQCSGQGGTKALEGTSGIWAVKREVGIDCHISYCRSVAVGFIAQLAGGTPCSILPLSAGTELGQLTLQSTSGTICNIGISSSYARPPHWRGTLTIHLFRNNWHHLAEKGTRFWYENIWTRSQTSAGTLSTMEARVSWLYCASVT